MHVNRRNFIRSLIYSGLLAGAGGGYILSLKVELLRLDVPIFDLPERLAGLTVGVMTDFHAGATGTRQVNEEAFRTKILFSFKGHWHFFTTGANKLPAGCGHSSADYPKPILKPSSESLQALADAVQKSQPVSML